MRVGSASSSSPEHVLTPCTQNLRRLRLSGLPSSAFSPSTVRAGTLHLVRYLKQWQFPLHSLQGTHPSNHKDSRVIIRLDVRNFLGLSPKLLRLFVIQEELALIICEVLHTRLIERWFATLGRGGLEVEVIFQDVVRVSSLWKIPPDRLCYVSDILHPRRQSPTLPSKVLSADVKMKRMVPLDILCC